jgi:hypothetical protein
MNNEKKIGVYLDHAQAHFVNFQPESENIDTINSDFDHFEKDDIEEGEERDWLVANHIDEKSTKFELRDDTVIIEFRDFPSYSYLYLFVNSDAALQHQIAKNNMGTLDMRILQEYMSRYVKP